MNITKIDVMRFTLPPKNILNSLTLNNEGKKLPDSIYLILLFSSCTLF